MTKEMILYVSLVITAFGTIYWWIRYVRAQADRDAMSMAIGEYRALNASLEHDKKRLNWLEDQQAKMPELGGIIFRWSQQGRGWRLHQTSRWGTVSTVRGAIDVAISDAKRKASER